MASSKFHIETWIAQHANFFTPPICNKLMYGDGQIKCFFVGGPNVRKDFHLEEGEEFFYMLKGDMELVVVEEGKIRNIEIKEGEVFLLPPRIPHSPQRFPNTMGLVIERERGVNEMDGLRYYVDDSTDILYEKWFHCDKIDTQLPPLIKEYFASEQFKTGKPIPGTILEDKPVKQDFRRVLDSPFSLKTFIAQHKGELDAVSEVKLFEGDYVSKINILGRGPHAERDGLPETFLWQLDGTAIVECENERFELSRNNTLLINKGKRWRLTNKSEEYTLIVVMDPQVSHL